MTDCKWRYCSHEGKWAEWLDMQKALRPALAHRMRGWSGWNQDDGGNLLKVCMYTWLKMQQAKQKHRQASRTQAHEHTCCAYQRWSSWLKMITIFSMHSYAYQKWSWFLEIIWLMFASIHSCAYLKRWDFVRYLTKQDLQHVVGMYRCSTQGKDQERVWLWDKCPLMPATRTRQIWSLVLGLLASRSNPIRNNGLHGLS